MVKRFTVEIRDYEQGGPKTLSAGRLEQLIAAMLDREGSDGIVIVKEVK